jgi:hypothetical protein
MSTQNMGSVVLKLGIQSIREASLLYSPFSPVGVKGTFIGTVVES